LTWLPVEAAGDTPLDRVLGLRPGLRAEYRAFLSTVWTRSGLDPVVLELCRLRVAQLLGCDGELAERTASARDAGLDEPKIAILPQWPTSPVFTATERACLAYAEQFVLDPHGVDDVQAADLGARLTPAGLVALTEALALFEGFGRLRLLLGVDAGVSR